MTAAPPDWSAIIEQVRCPLCEYNLRGLVDLRCPECGYEFDWPHLLDPTLRRHAYLFEHHPRHNVWSFTKTITRGFRRGDLWKTVYPSQPVSNRRLIIYWAICAAVSLMPIVVLVVSNVDWYYSPWLARFKYAVVSLYDPRYIEPGQIAVQLAILMALWPLMNGLVLLVFQQSMRRVRVRSRHALRCAIYSGDVIFWNGLWQALVISAWVLVRSLDVDLLAVVLLTVGTVAVFAVTAWRLRAAYQHYMQFRDAVSTVLASKFIMLILFCLLTSQTLFYWLMIRR